MQNDVQIDANFASFCIVLRVVFAPLFVLYFISKRDTKRNAKRNANLDKSGGTLNAKTYPKRENSTENGKKKK